MNAHAPITDDQEAQWEQEAREEAARIAIIRAFEAAVTAAESLPAGRAVLGECLGITHEHVAAGTPPAIALMGDLREDAKWWAECATPQELEVYGAEILRRIERTTFAENPRKRLMVALWESLTAEQQAAFIAKHGRTQGAGR